MENDGKPLEAQFMMQHKGKNVVNGSRKGLVSTQEHLKRIKIKKRRKQCIALGYDNDVVTYSLNGECLNSLLSNLYEITRIQEHKL